MVALMAFAICNNGGNATSSYGLNNTTDKAEYVYICTGPKSKCYHKTKNCQGLDRCSKEIEEVTLEEAENMGRTPCKGCY